MPADPPIPERPQNSFWLTRRTAILVVTVPLAVLLTCFRMEVFAPASAPASPGWQERLFSMDDMPLENIPVVVATEAAAEGISVTVANAGSTTIVYSANAYAPSDVELFQEFEELGRWTPAYSNTCGTGIAEFEILPGENVELAVEFLSSRRERMLTLFREKDAHRSALLLLAVEGPRMTFDSNWASLSLVSAIAAF